MKIRREIAATSKWKVLELRKLHFLNWQNKRIIEKLNLFFYYTFISYFLHMSYELSGKLIAKYDVVQRSESFKTREFVVEKQEDIKGRIISNYVKFQCVQEKTTIVDRVNVNDEIKVHFNIKGSKWEKDGRTNYITNLDAWRVEQFVNTGNTGRLPDNDHPEPLDTFSSTDGVDDLPF
ncbi:MAG: hypothetical protein NVS3B19_04340 [Ginsengibacter sp.]